jgi:hypothetical protein
MQHALHSHVHQVPVLGEDRGHAVPVLVRRVRRHPVDAVVGEEIDPCLPLLRVEELGLPVKKLLDFVLQLHHCAAM